MKEAVIICSNLSHIICAQAAINSLVIKEEIKYNVIIINPYLQKKDVKRIISFAKSLNIFSCIDLTHFVKPAINNQHNEFLEKNIILKFFFKSIYKKFYNIYLQVKIFDNLKSILSEKKLLNIDYLFTRVDQRVYESALIYSFNKINKYFCVEDGLGDYLEKNYIFFKLNYYEIKLKFKEFFVNIIYFIITFFFTLSLNKSLILASYKKIKFNKVFRNIKTDKSKFKYLDEKNIIYISHEYIKIITNLNNSYKFDYKVIIFDTLFNDKLKVEYINIPLFYNKIVNLIISNYKLKKNQILLKHHPRLKHQYWKILKDNLDCDILDFESKLVNFPGELLVNYKSVEQVYSVGSTALFYAKLLFNKKSFLITFDNQNAHPSDYKKYEHIFLKYNFEKLDVKKIIKI